MKAYNGSGCSFNEEGFTFNEEHASLPPYVRCRKINSVLDNKEQIEFGWHQLFQHQKGNVIDIGYCVPFDLPENELTDEMIVNALKVVYFRFVDYVKERKYELSLGSNIKPFEAFELTVERKETFKEIIEDRVY